jgi:hypothetical protein
MLTCACGARFEVDDTLAGQEVLCPECQQPLKAPALERQPRITSGWALASVVLALVGAFTVIGTLAAIVTGFVALVHVSRNRQRVTGTGFAICGIALGILLTGLTVFAFSANELFGLGGWLRERTSTQEIDTSGPLEIVLGAKGFAITRPTEKWGQVKNNQSDDPLVAGLQSDCDLLLMQVARNAFIDVRRQPAGNFMNLDQCQDDILTELGGSGQPNLFDEDDVRPFQKARGHNIKTLPLADGTEGREMLVDVRRAGQPWRFIVRTYRRANGTIFIARAYVRANRYAQTENELRKALDSFRLLPR